MLKIIKNQSGVSFLLNNNEYELTIKPQPKDEDFLLLHSPDGEVMKPDVLESIVSKLSLKLKDKRTGIIVAEDIGSKAGIEYGGNYQELFDYKYH